MTTKRTGYPIIDDILESIAPPSTEQPRPEQAGGEATAEIWPFCAKNEHYHCAGEAQLTRKGPPSKCACDCHEHHDAPAAPEQGEWHVHQNKREIVDERGFYVAFVTDESTAMQIVTEHSQYSTLIAQRERLLETLRKVRSMFFEDAQAGANVVDGKLEFADNELHPWIPGARAPKAIEIIDSVLTTTGREG